MEASAAAYDALYAPVCGDALVALYEGGARVTLEPPREGRPPLCVLTADEGACDVGARVSMRCSHPTIALLHGSMATWRQSAPLLAALRARLGARLVAVDALGCGASARPRRKGWLNRRGGGSESKLHRELWSAKDLLEDAACVVERVAGAADSKQRQEGGQLVLVAHSNGCKQALQLAQRLKPDAMVLISPEGPAGEGTRQAKALFSKLPLWLVRLMRSHLSRGFADGAVAGNAALRAVCLAHNARDDLVACQGFYTQLDEPLSDAQYLTATTACGKILVLSGEEDGIVPPAKSAALAAKLEVAGAKGCRQVVLHGAAHLAMLEQPAAIEAAVVGFLEEDGWLESHAQTTDCKSARLAWFSSDGGGEALAAAISERGCAGLRGALPLPIAENAARAIDATLEAALTAVRSGKAEEDELFGRVLTRENATRFDLKLTLGDGDIATAVRALALAARPAVAALLSEKALLVEMAAMVADPGAAAQPWHPDTQLISGCADGTPLYTVFAALQDLAGGVMGPTELLLGTNTAEAHQHAADISKAGSAGAGGAALAQDYPTCAAVPCAAGDAYVLDSRCWHRGGAVSPAREGGQRRRLLYLSFAAPGNAPPPGSTLTLADVYEGRLRLCHANKWR